MMQQHSQADWLSFGTRGGGKNDFVGGSFYMDLSLLQTTCIAYDRCGFWQGLFFCCCCFASGHGSANTTRSAVSKFQMEGSK